MLFLCSQPLQIYVLSVIYEFSLSFQKAFFQLAPLYASSLRVLQVPPSPAQPLDGYKLPATALSPRMSYKVGFCPRGSPRGLSAIALHLLHTEMVGHMASHSSAGLTSLFPEQRKRSPACRRVAAKLSLCQQAVSSRVSLFLGTGGFGSSRRIS